MQFSTLLPLIAFSPAASTDNADDSVQASSLDTAVELADSDNQVIEKRTLFLLAKTKYVWAHTILNKGVCWSCGSQNLGFGSSCCRCGTSTQVSCSTC